MSKFYVSLTYDLIGCYLVFNAESELAVRQYLARTYHRNGEWKLPWCAVYNQAQAKGMTEFPAILIEAPMGNLYED